MEGAKDVICYGILALRRKGEAAEFISGAYNLQSIPLIVRKKTPELMLFTSKAIVTRVNPGAGVSVRYNENMELYAHCESSSVSGTFIFLFTSTRYPVKAARNAAYELSRWLESKIVENPSYSNMNVDTELKARIVKYQDPLEVDKIAKITREVEEVKDLMVKNIDALLKRGESIDELVKQSEDLSWDAKQYAVLSKKLRRKCCVVM